MQRKGRTSSEVVDAIYGRIVLEDIIWKVLFTPEMQRLREVRLCNNNLVALPGGSNISRYEHSVGTAYLAQIAAKNLGLKPSSDDCQAFLVAALTHDAVSSAFGHTVEYVLNKCGFEHANIMEAIFASKYRDFEEDPLYMGYPPALKRLLPERILYLAHEFIQGRGSLGRLICGDIDLDNIDNIFRLAYHIGIPYKKGIAEAIAGSLTVRDGALVVSERSLELLQYWLRIRGDLYNQLFLRESNLAAGAMLSWSVELAVDKGEVSVNDWKCVDFELVAQLLDSAIPEVKTTIKRLMVGDFFSVIGILQTEDTSLYSALRFKEDRQKCEQVLRLLGINGFLYPILDRDKSSREINVLISESGSCLSLGEDAGRLLVGVVRMTRRWSAKTRAMFAQACGAEFRHDIDAWVRERVAERLGETLGCRFTCIDHRSVGTSIPHPAPELPSSCS